MLGTLAGEACHVEVNRTLTGTLTWSGSGCEDFYTAVEATWTLKSCDSWTSNGRCLYHDSGPWPESPNESGLTTLTFHEFCSHYSHCFHVPSTRVAFVSDSPRLGRSYHFWVVRYARADLCWPFFSSSSDKSFWTNHNTHHLQSFLQCLNPS